MTHSHPHMPLLACATMTHLIVAIGGCASPTWNGRIEQWGSMRAALRDGQTQGRVSLAHAVAKPHAYGVGALEGLTGEVAIFDGQCWIAQPDDHGSVLVVREPGEYRATLLAIAYVPTWNAVDIPRDVEPNDLDGYVRDLAVQQGLDPSRPFPFVIEGEFATLHAHVINGECPMQGSVASDHRPYRLDRENASGTLVGIYAEDSKGNLTHHDSSTHIHIISSAESPITAHVERVGLKAGARLRVPKP